MGFPRVPFRRRRDQISLTLRTLILTLLVLAIAGLSIVQPARKVAVVFIVDTSDSVGSANRAEQQVAIESAIAAKSFEDSWGVVVFGENAAVDQQMTTRNSVQQLRTTVETGNTNIASALNSALALFPSDSTPRIIILSDGQETLGNALQIAQRAAVTGVEIDYIPYERPIVQDVRVQDVSVPSRVAEGQPFDVTLTLNADRATSARLLLFLNSELLREQDLNVSAGESRYTFAQQVDETGLLNYTAQLIIPDDGYVQNNRLSAFTQVLGKPRVLLVADDDEEIASLIPALQNAGLEVEQTTPGNLPADTAALASYKAIVVANVPATRFSIRQMERLQTYVRDLGGGFVFIGGDESYGVGGYTETPIEDLLPVEMRIRDEQRIPQLTIAYLVDSSGSMETSDDGIYTYLQLAQQAIILSIELLQPDDRAAVGTFDSDGQWVAQFQNIEDKQALQQQVAALQPGGGTDIRAGLRLVERDIVNEPAPLKHIILLTDGGANSNALVETAQRLYEQYNVTMTTIAIGLQPPRFLEDMALVSNGRHYLVTDGSQIPNIFAQDTLLATRSYLIEGDFVPGYSAVSQIMNGIAELPALQGYVATTTKDTAQVVLRGNEPYFDPILAQWQYGLGRAVAFTSDATNRWGNNWLSWADYGRFWGQAISWTMTESAASNLEMTITQEGELARVTLDARTDTDEFLNGARFVGSLLLPSNEVEPLSFQQTNAGQYTATFRPQEEGAYFVALTGADTEGNAYSMRDGWVKAYSAEYTQELIESSLLQDVAALTGGTNLSADPAQAFAPPQNPRTATVSLAPLLFLLALLLLPFDIAVRRLIVTRSDLQRLRQWAFPTRTIEEDTRLNTLKEAKQRARQDTIPTSVPMPLTPEPPRPATPSTPVNEPAKPVSGEESTVGALLKRRKGG